MIERKFNTSVSHDKLRLHSSERNSSWGIVFDEFKNELTEEDIKFYPNTEELIIPLSRYYGTKSFLMGFGSDRCIKYFFEGNKRKKNLIVTDPTFPMYNVYGQMFNMSTISVPYKSLDFPLNDLINSVTKNSVIVISNPSSPIGNIIPRGDLIRILKLGVPTLIDEAYIEFSDEKSMISKIKEFPNLYVTRTFSKALGSAGIRFGMIFSNEKNINKLQQFRDMYETSGMTIKWVMSVLNHTDMITKYVDDVKKNRITLTEWLTSIGYTVISSDSNWVHVKDFNFTPEKIIFKRDCSLPGLGDGWVRLQITDELKDYVCLFV
jgi:histidinol-phosphate aminotransferase